MASTPEHGNILETRDNESSETDESNECNSSKDCTSSLTNNFAVRISVDMRIDNGY